MSIWTLSRKFTEMHIGEIGWLPSPEYIDETYIDPYDQADTGTYEDKFAPKIRDLLMSNGVSPGVPTPPTIWKLEDETETQGWICTGPWSEEKIIDWTDFVYAVQAITPEVRACLIVELARSHYEDLPFDITEVRDMIEYVDRWIGEGPLDLPYSAGNIEYVPRSREYAPYRATVEYLCGLYEPVIDIERGVSSRSFMPSMADAKRLDEKLFDDVVNTVLNTPLSALSAR